MVSSGLTLPRTRSRCGDELGDAFKGEILGLHGDDEGVGGAKCVEGEQVERGRAIEDDEVVLVANGRKSVTEFECTLLGIGELDVGTGEVFGAGKNPEVVDFGGENDRFGCWHRP